MLPLQLSEKNERVAMHTFLLMNLDHISRGTKRYQGRLRGQSQKTHNVKINQIT